MTEDLSFDGLESTGQPERLSKGIFVTIRRWCGGGSHMGMTALHR